VKIENLRQSYYKTAYGNRPKGEKRIIIMKRRTSDLDVTYCRTNFVVMKRPFYILPSLLLLCVNSFGQEVKTIKADTTRKTMESRVEIVKHVEPPTLVVCPEESMPDAHLILDEQRQDSLRLPVLNGYGQVPLSLYPLGWMGWYNWELHKGLNLNFGASVFGTFGKNSVGGTGFGQNIAAMYAVPLTGKLSLAVGGYFNNVYWADRSFRDGGFNAVIGYRFDDRWETYLYGQKSIGNRRMPFPLYDVTGVGDHIGAAVKYNFSPKFSVTVSVEERRY